MAVDHEVIQLALQARVKTMSVCTTGALSMSVVADGYVRASGSFLTDRFARGMELLAAGFALAGNNGVAGIVAVTAEKITVDRALTVAVAASASLVVGEPSQEAFENRELPSGSLVVTRPLYEEQYDGGPSSAKQFGADDSEVETDPTFFPRIHVPIGTGRDAAQRYAKALLALFPPRLAITLSDGNVLRVRTDVAPFAGQLLPSRDGYAAVPVSIPLSVRTPNTL